MRFAVPLPAATGDEAADLAAFTAWELAGERHYHPDRFGAGGARLPQPRRFEYYLGVPEPSWLGKSDSREDGGYPCSGIPKFVSAARLARYRTDGDRWPVTSTCTYAIDSGAYIALSGTNPDVPWFADSDVYGGMILRFMDNNGYWPDFCAPQDWPCEPPVRARTGFTVRQHQQLTLDSYLWLAREFYMVPWIPVLQGWEASDYLIHARMYEDAGVDLAGAIRVGVGSICRRGHLPEIVEVIEQFAEAGYAMHGFGIKTTALPLIGQHLRSADSMAWSKNARDNHARLPDCTHAGEDCRNCYRYAVRWRKQVLAALPNPKEPTMPTPTVKKKPAKKTTPVPAADLFAGMADFAALVAGDLGLTDVPGARLIPLADVEWGMYGSVTGYGPTGGKPKQEEGYITKLPRVTTRGFSSIGRTAKRTGEPLLDFVLEQPNGHGGGSSLSMFAEVDAVFTVMDPPVDRPLTRRKYLGRRMPAADVRRGDVFYLWDDQGLKGVVGCGNDRRPRYHVQEDPTDIGGGQVALDVFVDGELLTKKTSSDTWLDVEDPRSWPWQRAHIINTRRLPGKQRWYVWDCSCGYEPEPGEWSHQDAAQTAGEFHAREALAPQTQRPPSGSKSLRAGACGNPGDKHGRTIEVGDRILGVDVGAMLGHHIRTDFAGVVVRVHQDEIDIEDGEVLPEDTAPWVAIELDDGTERDFPPHTWFSVAPGADPTAIVWKPGQRASWTNATGQTVTTTITADMLCEDGLDVGWDITIPFASLSLAAVQHEMVMRLAPHHTRWTYRVGCATCDWEFDTGVNQASAPQMFEIHHLAKKGVTLDAEQRQKLLELARELGDEIDGDTAPVRPAAEPEHTETAGTAGDGLDDVRAVLARSVIEPTRVALPDETLPHELWESVHAVLKGMGATGGSRKGQPYRFKTDRAADVAAFVAGGPAPLHERTKLGWVPTPGELAADVVARFAEVGLLPDEPRVLEPSAGEGALVRAVLAAVPTAKVTAVEPVAERAYALGKIPAVYPLHVTTIEKYAERFKREKEQPYDLILMNPPYSVPGNRTLWADHVKLAWSMLAEGGRLVAIVPDVLDRSTSRVAAEVLTLLGRDAMVEKLPPRSFRQSGTDFDTCVVAATKVVTSVEKALARYAASIYAPVYDPVKAVRHATEPRLDAVAAIEMPNQVVAGFAGDVRIAYAGKCIACSLSTWTDGNNDPRGFLGGKAAQPLTPDVHGLEGPEVTFCWDCQQSGIMHARGLARAREMWTDPECDDVEPEELTLFSLDDLGEAVAAALARK